MKQFYLLFSFMLIFSSSIAQNMVSYAYDYAGNRISRKIVQLNSSPNHVKKSGEPDPVEDQLGERKITIYPNPTKGALAVEITGGDTKDAINFTLFSAQGVQLQTRKVTASVTPVDMSVYSSGWYILRVSAGSKVTEFKIINNNK